jgi:Flp pilus assembly CpaF family ATPase
MRSEMKLTVIRLIYQHLGLIKPFMDDPQVTEIMVNSPTSIWVEKAGQIARIPGEIETDVLDRVIGMLGTANGRKNADRMKILDAEMPGLRIAAARAGVAIHGPCISIRKHSAVARTLRSYVESGLFDPTISVPRVQINRPEPIEIANGREGLYQFLRWMVSSRSNFVVSGATSSGKTSFLNAILRELIEIDPTRRLFTIEDTRELMVMIDNFVSFLAQKNDEETDSRALGRLALRMRPDSILHGEVRGSEAYDLMDAYRTGHPGSGVSFHAESAELAPYRLETMVRMAPEGRNLPLSELRRQISQTFQFFIHCEQINGLRMPVQIFEMRGADESAYSMTPVFVKTKEFG